MKFVKGISLFFIYPVFLLCLGFYAGVRSSHFFYPGERLYTEIPSLESPILPEEDDRGEGALAGGEPSAVGRETDSAAWENDRTAEEKDQTGNLAAMREDGSVLAAAAVSETLSVETEYVLEERDMAGNTTVETTWRLPDRYVGMNREQFLQAMEVYEAAPPLSELERGFVSLEVLSFSREKVVVQMNYRYVLPSSSFYLAAYDNEVIVYLEDRETVYIETGISLEELPEELQREIIQMLWIEDEEALYDFLEAYSS
ncbi:MAG: hypothetical protein NC432_02025 [Roseburia sp.]|nr:hypothetical protein [Roseburia sp.]MCM1097408.1 hypothetical protein [Ruminococcus flavefaciens]